MQGGEVSTNKGIKESGKGQWRERDRKKRGETRTRKRINGKIKGPKRG